MLYTGSSPRLLVAVLCFLLLVAVLCFAVLVQSRATKRGAQTKADAATALETKKTSVDAAADGKTLCSDPRNFYTFDRAPHCLKRACDKDKTGDVCTARLKQMVQLATAEGRRNPRACKTRFPFHVFWQGPLKRAVRLMIWSVLRTQRCGHLTVWSSTPLPKTNEQRSQLESSPAAKGKLTFRVFDPVALSRSTPYETFASRLIINKLNTSEIKNLVHLVGGLQYLVGYSDFVRVLVLYLFGGIYIDSDVIMLRDMWPLHGRAFDYRWSCQEYCNTAVLSTGSARSPAAENVAKSLPPNGKLRAVHPQILSRIMNLPTCNPDGKNGNRCLDMLPPIVFDAAWTKFDWCGKPNPRWGGTGWQGKWTNDANHSVPDPMKVYEDGFENFFSVTGYTPQNVLDTFAPGSLAYHSHTLDAGGGKVNNGSAFWALEQLFVPEQLRSGK